MALTAPQRAWTPVDSRWAVAILILATALRLFQLGEQPIWCDESLFWQYANRPGGWLTCVLHTMADDVYPPLFFLLLHFLGLFTDELFWMRLPMALAGIASVGVLLSLLRRSFSPRVALFGAALAASSPVLVYYSQELKMYSFLALFLLLTLDELLRCLDDPQRGWRRLALWAALSVYTFYLSVIVWVCLVAALLLKEGTKTKGAQNALKGFGAALFLFLPWSPIFIKSIVQNQGSTYNLLMERAYLYSYQNFSVGFWVPVSLAWAALPTYGMLAWRGAAVAKKTAPKLLIPLLIFTFLPLLLSWGVSLAAKPIYSDRAMLACAFGWLALVALGLDSLPRRVAELALALLLGANAFALQRYYFDPFSQRADYKPAWEHVVQAWQPGDAVFHTHIDSYYPFRFFALQESRRPDKAYRELPGIQLPEGTTRAEGLRPNWIHSEPPPFTSNEAAGRFRQAWRSVNAWLKARGRGLYTGYNRDLVSGERLRQEALPGVRRIWYLSTDRKAAARAWMPQVNVYRSGFEGWVPFEPDKLDWLQKDFKLVSKVQVAETDIHLYEAKPGRKKGP